MFRMCYQIWEIMSLFKTRCTVCGAEGVSPSSNAEQVRNWLRCNGWDGCGKEMELVLVDNLNNKRNRKETNEEPNT